MEFMEIAKKMYYMAVACSEREHERITPSQFQIKLTQSEHFIICSIILCILTHTSSEEFLLTSLDKKVTMLCRKISDSMKASTALVTVTTNPLLLSQLQEFIDPTNCNVSVQSYLEFRL